MPDPRRPKPNIDSVRDAMRSHDEREEEDEASAESPQGEAAKPPDEDDDPGDSS